MIKRSEVIENVKENSSTVIKFLGFIKKSPPPIVVRKIKEELENKIIMLLKDKDTNEDNKNKKKYISNNEKFNDNLIKYLESI